MSGNTITIKTQKLHEWQRDVIDLYKKHPYNSVIVIKSARQRGKTYTLMMLSLYRAINYKNSNVIIITPTFAIARKQFNDFNKALKNLPILESNNSSHFEFKLKNGSTIKFLSAESGNNLRGYTADLLIFDEASFILMETALECMNYVNTTNGNVVIASTPKFKSEQCLFYKFYKEAIDNTPNVYLVDFCEYDTSCMLPEDKLELYKKTLPHNTFQNEILGEFLTANSSVFGNLDNVLRNRQLEYNNLVGGVDWATNAGNDETVIQLFNNKKENIKLFHFNDKTAQETVEFIANVIQEFGVVKLVVEKNSIGDIYYQLLKDTISKRHLNCQLIAFNTTNKSKREIIENLILNIQNETITLLDDLDLKLQFINYEMQTTKTGLITYNNSNNNIHDDIVIATALALHAFKSGGYAVR